VLASDWQCENKCPEFNSASSLVSD